MWRRRWKWVEDCDEWSAFVAWRDSRPWAQAVQIHGALDTVLAYGPEHDSPRVGDDLYVVYAPCNRTVSGIIVGVARPGCRLLLPLVWGAAPTADGINEAAAEAAEKLRVWRSRT